MKYQSRVSINDTVINGIKVNNSRWTSELINPGKTAIIDIELASVFSRTYWDMYGIDKIKDIRIGIGQSDFEEENKSDPSTIEIALEAGGDVPDTSGITAYDKDGLRFIYKGIAGGKYDYDKNLYIIFLVESKSGKTAVIDGDDVSINGFMADTLAFSSTVEDGECTAWKIEIYDRSLKNCEVKDASDIKDIELTLKTRDEKWMNKKEEKVSIKSGS